MSLLLLALSILMAFAVGIAIRHGGICAVRAINHILNGQGPELFLAFFKCSAWVALVTVPIVWLVPQVDLPVVRPVVAMAVLGALVYGFGAGINGGCAFATLSYIGSGHAGYLSMPVGMLAGYLVQGRLLARTAVEEFPSPLQQANLWSITLIGALALLAVIELWNLWQRGAFRPAQGRGRWSPSAAVMVIGICGGLLGMINGGWNFTALLNGAAQNLNQDQPILSGQYRSLLLVTVLVIGVVVSARMQDGFQPRWGVEQAVRSLIGGGLMGFGAGMVPGGNDTLILQALPALAISAIPAYAALVLGALGGVLLRRRLRRPSPA